MYRIWYTRSVPKKLQSTTSQGARPEAAEKPGKRVAAVFFRTEAGGEPVRGWLKGLSTEDRNRKRIGEDLKTVEFGWPPVCRLLGDGVYEVRTSRAEPNRAAAFLYRQEKPDGSAPWIHEENSEDSR
jgi:hypothetical protein